jgi:hypothetical protein
MKTMMRTLAMLPFATLTVLAAAIAALAEGIPPSAKASDLILQEPKQPSQQVAISTPRLKPSEDSDRLQHITDEINANQNAGASQSEASSQLIIIHIPMP